MRLWRCLPYACEYDPDLLGLDRDNLMEETRKLATRLGVSIRLGRGDFMAHDSKDKSVLGHIDGLVKEEERLYSQGELTDDDRSRLAKIKIELDQYWDLLRQRRALREFGRNPDQAKVRPSKVVEDYEQ